jgi:hypothetical protein
VSFGDYGLKALEPCWLTDRQIEAARVAMTRFIARGGKIWRRVFPDKPITKKPQETRMGKGKARPSSGSASSGRAGVVRDGRRDREGRARSDAAGGGEAADHDQVRDPLRAGEDVMKAANCATSGADELGAKGARPRPISWSGWRIQKSMGQLEAPDKLRTSAPAILRASKRCSDRSERRSMAQKSRKVGTSSSANKMQKSIVVR